MSSSLLLKERPLIIIPTLVLALGWEQAVIIQQVHFLLSESDADFTRGKKLGDGKRYIFYTHDEWHKRYFPFIPVNSIRKAMRELERKGLLISAQPDGTDRRKYYRLGEGAAQHLTYERLAEERRGALVNRHARPRRTVVGRRIDPSLTDGSSNKTETTETETTSSKTTMAIKTPYNPPSPNPSSNEEIWEKAVLWAKANKGTSRKDAPLWVQNALSQREREMFAFLSGRDNP